MRTTILNQLIILARQGVFFKHVSFLLTGWAALFRLLPPGPTPPALRLKDLLIGVCVVALVIGLAGPLLNALVPTLRFLGGLSAFSLVSLTLGLISIQRYFVGRGILNAITPPESHDD